MMLGGDVSYAFFRVRVLDVKKLCLGKKNLF